jgi:hypothetical protein
MSCIIISQVKAYGPDPVESGGSSNTVIMSGGGILAVTVGFGWNQANPVIGHDHCISASTLLPLSRGSLKEIGDRNHCPRMIITVKRVFEMIYLYLSRFGFKIDVLNGVNVNDMLISHKCVH